MTVPPRAKPVGGGGEPKSVIDSKRRRLKCLRPAVLWVTRKEGMKRSARWRNGRRRNTAGANGVAARGQSFRDRDSQHPLPAWLTPADLDFFTGEFQRSGFRGGFNWYRNIDRNWELTAFLDGTKLRQPSMFAAGEHDVVLRMVPGARELVDSQMPACRSNTVISVAGHWIQQERPAEINRLLLEFLSSVR